MVLNDITKLLDYIKFFSF